MGRFGCRTGPRLRMLELLGVLAPSLEEQRPTELYRKKEASGFGRRIEEVALSLLFYPGGQAKACPGLLLYR